MPPNDATHHESDDCAAQGEFSNAATGWFSRGSTRIALFGGAAILCAFIFFAISHSRQRAERVFFFDAATPPASAPLSVAKPENISREHSRRLAPAPKALATPVELMVIHVAGEVKKPGVYKLPMGARIYQAIARAGGTKSSADVNAINLAARAEDGSRIEVPSKNAPRESVPARESAPRVSSFAKREKSVKPRASAASARKAENEARLRANPVNLNSASAQQLEELPGVGPAMAARILEFRAENGSFSSVEELDEVRGIGPKKLEKLRPLVRAN